MLFSEEAAHESHFDQACATNRTKAAHETGNRMLNIHVTSALSVGECKSRQVNSHVQGR